MASLGGYGAINGDNQLSGGTTSPGRDFIDTHQTITTAGTFETVDLYTIDAFASGEIEIKIWRVNGSNYDYVGGSGKTITFSAGLNSGVSLPSSISVQVGDLIGVWVQNNTGEIEVDSNSGNDVDFQTSDASTSQAISGFTTLSNFSLCVEAHGTAGGGGPSAPLGGHSLTGAGR